MKQKTLLIDYIGTEDCPHFRGSQKTLIAAGDRY